ncbi:hypothetical protein [Sulfuricurvum sp.]|uniref:hypothetical protein n=1 Tax=Sulfuricurvum sp. TaxID=2025608 RepID=UPI00356A2B4C
MDIFEQIEKDELLRPKLNISSRTLLRLPKCARDEMLRLQTEVLHQRKIAETLSNILDAKNHDWFCINGPMEDAPENDKTILYALQKNDAIAVCSLFKGDQLFIGRKARKQGGGDG